MERFVVFQIATQQRGEYVKNNAKSSKSVHYFAKNVLFCKFFHSAFVEQKL